MTFLEVRNTLVSSLAAALGIPVLLSDQVQPEAEVPFIVWYKISIVSEADRKPRKLCLFLL